MGVVGGQVLEALAMEAKSCEAWISWSRQYYLVTKHSEKEVAVVLRS